MANRTCTVDGCERKHMGRGLCSAHYHRWRRTGRVGDARVNDQKISRTTNPICAVVGCDRPTHSRGWCANHYSRFWRHGHPTEVGCSSGRELAPARGDISYNHAHRRLRAQLGRASERLCRNGCGRMASHWAYDHSDPNELEDDEGLYSLDPDRYWAMCPSCHVRHDRAMRHIRETGQLERYLGIA